MILEDKATVPYLKAFKEGRIKRGVGIGCLLDDYFLYKNGNFNMFLGLDNVGKTNFPNDPPANLFEPMEFDWPSG